jgi:hypothetical protein
MLLPKISHNLISHHFFPLKNYKTSYSGGRNQEDCGSKASLGQKVSRTPFPTKKPEAVVHGACHPSYRRSINRRIKVQGWYRQKREILFDNITDVIWLVIWKKIKVEKIEV